jgi:FkbM family methyltransferase
MQSDVAWGAGPPPLLDRMAIGAIRKRIARGGMKRLLRAYLRKTKPFYDVEIDGLKMRCHIGDNHTEELLAEGRYDSKIADIARLLEGLETGGVLVDVGANCGLFTVFGARAVGPAGTVIAVEPLAAMRERLAFNVAVNGFRNVHIAPVAVGPKAGTLVLNADVRQLGQSSVAARRGHCRPMTVAVQPLRDIVEQAGLERVDALKIDIEGFEDRALLPFFRTAPRSMWPRRVFTETAHGTRWQSDLLGEMQSLGYRIAWQSRADALLALSA